MHALAHLGPDDGEAANVREDLHRGVAVRHAAVDLRGGAHVSKGHNGDKGEGCTRTFICGKSTPESTFMASETARVMNAFASSVARATCAGVVYDDMPITDTLRLRMYAPDRILTHR